MWLPSLKTLVIKSFVQRENARISSIGPGPPVADPLGMQNQADCILEKAPAHPRLLEEEGARSLLAQSFLNIPDFLSPGGGVKGRSAFGLGNKAEQDIIS